MHTTFGRPEVPELKIMSAVVFLASFVDKELIVRRTLNEKSRRYCDEKL